MSLFSRDRFRLLHLESERALKPLGLSRRAVDGLIRAGVFGPRALMNQPWTDEEAGARFTSLGWRLSVDPICGPTVAREVERARSVLLTQRQAAAD